MVRKRQKGKGQTREEKRGERERETESERVSPRSDLQTRVYHRRRIYFGGCNHLPLHYCRSSLITSYNPSAVGRGRRGEGGEEARAATSIWVAGVGVIANVITHVAQTTPFRAQNSLAQNWPLTARIPTAERSVFEDDQIDDLRKMSRGY